MSIDVNIHIWPGDIGQYEPLDFFGRVLDCVAKPQNLDIDGAPPARFGRLKVCDTTSSEAVIDCSLNTDDVDKVLEELKSFLGPKFHYEVWSAFDHLRYDNDTNNIEPWLHPLTINYFGPEYEWQGHDFKRYGPIRIDFSNTKVFQIPLTLIDRTRETASKRRDVTRNLQMITKLGRNFDTVSELAKRLILKLNPKHLLVCTELEVHPLTSHSIFHRDWQDYCEDLRKIAWLHEYGGVYFCEVAPDQPAFIEPRKSPPDYGYLRRLSGDQTEAEFVYRLQPYVNQILAAPRSANLSNAQIKECFQALGSTMVEAFHDSYCLSVTDPPFAYLEEPYMKLYEVVCRSKNGN